MPRSMVTVKVPDKNQSIARREDSREAILEAALILFTEKGYEGTSIDDIRTASGFRSKASLYTHFKSKEEISSALIKRILEKIDRVIVTAEKSSIGGPLSRFKNVFQAYIEWAFHHRQEFAFRIIRAQELRMLTGHYDFQGETFDQSTFIYPTIIDILESLRADYTVRTIENAALFHMAIGAISRAVIDADTFGDVSVAEKADLVFQVCVGIVFNNSPA
jgi:AcrR family transcriptional regulator